MRIRSIKPEFWRSEDVAALPWETRLLYIGLWSYVDDNGVGRDLERLIVADLFALEDNPRDTLASISRGLQQLSEGGQITRYSVGGKPYIYVNAWDDHQKIDRPNKARYPLPTCDDTVIRDTLASISRVSRDTLATGAVEQGNKGTEDQGAVVRRTAAEESFQEFWDAYPKKVGKDGARRAFVSAVKRVGAITVLGGVHRYAADPNRQQDPQFIPGAQRWLNEGRFADPLAESSFRPTGAGQPGPRPLTPAEQTVDITRDLVARLQAEERQQHAQIGN